MPNTEAERELLAIREYVRKITNDFDNGKMTVRTYYIELINASEMTNQVIRDRNL